jgi:hypothetical protein
LIEDQLRPIVGTDGGDDRVHVDAKTGEVRGSGPKNMIFSNGSKIIFEWSSLLY